MIENEMSEDFKYVFGPVPSRRLGLSLGVDLVPYKTCTYDCIYCQIGHTTCKTTERKAYVPVDDVLSEAKQRLASGPRPDFITLSGSGEPTLHVDVGRVIKGLKAIADIPVAVLTNGSLLWMREVRQSLLAADLVLPSLDAGSQEVFERINCPHQTIGFERMVEGLISFRKQYSGKLWLEVFLVGGINDTDQEIDRMVSWVKRIRPDRVQLNTVTRPPAEERAQPVSEERLIKIARRFVPPAEVIADLVPEMTGRQRGSLGDVEAMCRRRPCTVEDISRAFDLNPAEVAKYLHELQRRGSIEIKRTAGRTYFVTSKKP